MVAPHAEPQRVFQKIEYITGFWEPPSGMAVSCAETTGRFMYISKTVMINFFFSRSLICLVCENIYCILKPESEDCNLNGLRRMYFFLRNQRVLNWS